jgi:hypothetical protein
MVTNDLVMGVYDVDMINVRPPTIIATLTVLRCFVQSTTICLLSLVNIQLLTTPLCSHEQRLKKKAKSPLGQKTRFDREGELIIAMMGGELSLRTKE